MSGESEDGLRARLLDCALRMVAEEGVEALTLRAIARRAGVSHGAPLRHFPGRAALLSAVATAGYLDLARRGEDAVEGHGPRATGAQRLHAALRAYVEFALDNPGLYELMSRQDLLLPTEPALSQASRSVFETLVRLVAQRQTEERWHADADPRLVAGALWGAAHGFTQLWMMGAFSRASRRADLDDALAVTLRVLDLDPRDDE